MIEPRWAPRALLLLAALLIPWTIFLSVTLPRRQVVHHWDVAWVGFDVVTSSAHARWFSVGLAVLAELPLAAFCLWVAHAVHVRSK